MIRSRVYFSLFAPTVVLVFLFFVTIPTANAVSYDGNAPTSPTNVTATVSTNSSPKVIISWGQAMDTIGVTRYNIYRNGTFLFSPQGVGVTYVDTSVVIGQTYTYSVQAGDGDGNNGPQSDTIEILVSAGAVSHIITPVQITTEHSAVETAPSATSVYSNEITHNQSSAGTQPENLKLSSFKKELHLTWKNPKNNQWKSTRVIKKNNSYPVSVTDGTIICDGVKEECVDKEVLQKTTYYYGVYAVDQSFMTSQLVVVSGALLDEVKVDVPQVVQDIGTPRTPFTRTLKLKSVGDEVLLLQKFLNTHGFSVATSGLGSAGSETTLFGPATEKALKAYQCSKKIVCGGDPVSTGYGMVGKTTRGYLNKKEQ